MPAECAGFVVPLRPGHSHPDHQVIAVAINSGLVTYPTGYTLVWESPGISLWRPVPPAGYVAMGCVASVSTGSAAGAAVGPAGVPPQPSAGTQGPVPPSRKACVVVAKQVAVEALLAECMMLCTNGNLWCIQNSCGTFEVAPPDAHQPQVCRPATTGGQRGWLYWLAHCSDTLESCCVAMRCSQFSLGCTLLLVDGAKSPSWYGMVQCQWGRGKRV